MEKNEQLLKCRDDQAPVLFSVEDPKSSEPFRLAKGASCSWQPDGQPFGASKLRSRIEPWLTALVQSEHLSLLVGSGLSHAVYGLGTGSKLPGMGAVKFSVHDKEITEAAKRSATGAGRMDGNIEDQIRVVNELIRGMQVLLPGGGSGLEKKVGDLRADLNRILGEFAASILAGERGLIAANKDQREQAFNYLVSFLMSFASRTGTRDRLHIFTTNYDRFIEAGAEAAGLRLIDRFVGSLAAVFRSSRLDVDMHYNPPGIRGEPRYLEGVARFTKLHGSLDWVDAGNAIRRVGVAFGAPSVGPYLEAPGLASAEAMQLMIYPNAAKDQETAAYPYVELFRDFAAAVCRPNCTLVCFGYSFGDEHINRVIEDMLTIPSSHLVVIARGDPLGRILGTYERLGRSAQVTLMLGDHLGDLQALVDNYLPKPAIDRTTFRMAELLRGRWGSSEDKPAAQEPSVPTPEEV